ADPYGEVPHERTSKQACFGEPAPAATPGVLAAPRQPEHQAVDRQRARVVGHEEATSLGRNAIDSVHLDAKILLVEELEQWQDLVLVGRVVSELVDLFERQRLRRRRRIFAGAKVGRE